MILNYKKWKRLFETNDLPKVEPGKSDRLGKGGSFEQGLRHGMSSEQYFELRRKVPPGEIKRLRLVFPQSKWEELALKLIKALNVITGIFTNITSAIDYIRSLVNKGVKVDELVIGSHGDVGTLLSTQTGDSNRFNNEFLIPFKDIVHPKTKVFFTACRGADYLDSLKDAAERLGVGAYGSAGIYNYITNASEKGYYWCSAQPIDKSKLGNEKVPAFDFEVDLINAYLLKNKKIEKLKYQIVTKNGVFDRPVGAINGETALFTDGRNKNEEIQYSEARAVLHFMHFRIDLRRIFEDVMTSATALKNRGETWENNSFRRRQVSLGSKYIDTFLKEKFESGEIQIFLQLEDGPVNLKSAPPILKPKKITNELLLAGGFCRRIDSPPIEWEVPSALLDNYLASLKNK